MARSAFTDSMPAVLRRGLLWGLLFAGLAACSPSSSDERPAAFETEAVDRTAEVRLVHLAGLRGRSAEARTFPKKITFEHACSSGERTTVAAVGDVLLHSRLQRQAYRDGPGTLWEKVQPLLQAADVTYANLEGPVAPGVLPNGRSVERPGKVYDDRVYTSYPTFNYHPVLLDGLRASGVDVVSTANNHSLDRRSLGVDKTLSQLEQRDVNATGTRSSAPPPRRFWTLTEQDGFRLAWLACTYGTNGIQDGARQVLYCYNEKDRVLTTVTRLSDRTDIDAVLVTPHWGDQYTHDPKDRQVTFAHQLLEAGATAVIGSHPHVIQPWDTPVTEAGREGFVLYSLGNFVSGQRELPRRTTLVLYLGLTRTQQGVRINGVRYVPAHMSARGDSLTLKPSQHEPVLSQSFNHATDMLGTYNLQDPRKRVDTTPTCTDTTSESSIGWRDD